MVYSGKFIYKWMRTGGTPHFGKPPFGDDNSWKKRTCVDWALDIEIGATHSSAEEILDLAGETGTTLSYSYQLINVSLGAISVGDRHKEVGYPAGEFIP